MRVEELIDVERLWNVARAGTGRGVRVAILDTGVDAEHPALEGSVRSCREVAFAGPRPMIRETSGDPVGHGTACAGIIHNLAPEAELHSLRVIGTNASGTIEQLIQGLRWAIAERFEVVNLSLGTVQKRQVSILQELVDEAYFKGQFLITAANNHRLVSYPAQFASLIAVDNQAFADPSQFHYRLGQAIELVAHGIYVRAPSPGGKFRWFTGTSFACPQIAGVVARLKSELPDLTPFQVKSLLYCLRANREQPASVNGAVGAPTASPAAAR
jgi:subtilisin family serine protease